MALHYKTKALCLIVFGLMLGCTSPPESHNAQVRDAQQAPNETAASNQLAVDLEKSKVTWIGTKPTGRHQGFIKFKEAFLSIQNDSITGANITMDMASIDITDLDAASEDYQKLSAHLKSREFFDVDNFPIAVFMVTDIKPINKKDAGVNQEIENAFKLGKPSHLVTGNLTIKATTLSISFPCKIDFGTEEIIARAKFNIDRTKWGVSYNQESKFVDKAKDGLINNTVHVGFELSVPNRHHL